MSGYTNGRLLNIDVGEISGLLYYLGQISTPLVSYMSKNNLDQSVIWLKTYDKEFKSRPFRVDRKTEGYAFAIADDSATTSYLYKINSTDGSTMSVINFGGYHIPEYSTFGFSMYSPQPDIFVANEDIANNRIVLVQYEYKRNNIYAKRQLSDFKNFIGLEQIDDYLVYYIVATDRSSPEDIRFIYINADSTTVINYEFKIT